MPLILGNDDNVIEYIKQQSSKNTFVDYSPLELSSRQSEKIEIATDKSSIRLKDKKQGDIVAIVNGAIVTFHDKEYYEISGAYSKYRRRGYVTYIYRFIVYELGYNILSDRKHTSPGSKEFWQAQIRRKSFNIYRINIKTNYKRKASRYKETEIWAEYKANTFNLLEYFEESEDLHEKNSLNDGNLENLSSLEFELDELDVETKNELETELGIITNKQELNMEDIRLIAQKC